jgi:hypothetical protein
MSNRFGLLSYAGLMNSDQSKGLRIMANKRLLCIDDQEDTCALVSSILSDYEVVSEHTQ